MSKLFRFADLKFLVTYPEDDDGEEGKDEQQQEAWMGELELSRVVVAMEASPSAQLLHFDLFV